MQEVLLFLFDPHEMFLARFEDFKWSQEVIDQGLHFYTPENLQSLRVDDAFLLELIEKHTKKTIAPEEAKNFENDPFKRMFSSHSTLSDLTFSRTSDTNTHGQSKQNTSYHINPPFVRNALRDPWDDIMIRSLYCDFGIYDETDFLLLQSLQDNKGNYFDTHFLLGLLLLEKNECYEKESIKKNKEAVVKRIISAEQVDTVSSDLYAERIVFLYWAGYGQAVQKEWIDIIRNSLATDSGWRTGKDTNSNAHTTGLALLSLLYYEEGKNMQRFYP